MIIIMSHGSVVSLDTVQDLHNQESCYILQAIEKYIVFRKEVIYF